MKKMLVTGGAGFIGSNFVHRMLEKGLEVVVLDFLTYAGNLENLQAVQDHPQYHFYHGNICDRSLLHHLFEEHGFDTVVNFAAESHVDRSIEHPEVFLSTNIVGTQALLEAAKAAWKRDPLDRYCTSYRQRVRFLQVSTDEVYGSLGRQGLFKEDTPLAPNSPYSASKASADLIVRAYHQTYQMPVLVTRCSNNYGPYQFPEKLIPLIIYNTLRDKPLPVYGDGLQVRDWLHVHDHCSALYAVLERGEPGEVYNIGGGNEKTNLEIIERILDFLGKPKELIHYVQDRLGHDRRYAIDAAKIQKLGWQPLYVFENGLEKTIEWYVENRAWVERITSGAYTRYYEEMYQGRE